MRMTYRDLVIELPVDGIKAVDSIEIFQRLNEHGKVKIRLVVEEEQALELVEQADSSLNISVSTSGGRFLFCGKGDRISTRRDEGLLYLYAEFYGYTRDWDLTEKSQSFCKGNDTYEQVLHKVLAEYAKKDIRDEASGGAKIPGMLLQYEETDWEFLKRLASHFSTYLLADDTTKNGRVYFGIPRMDKGAVLKDEEYTMLRGKERYDGMEGAEGLLSQDMTGWRIRTRKQLVFGEQVMLNHIETVVTAVDIHTEQGDLVYEYELSRRAGILCEKKKNSRIYGMSIPATVKERKGNQIRVKLDIDPVYEASDDLKYFTYAIETSNFYCMPEEESRVHIYFPSHDEQDAMAVHALSAGSVPGGPAGGTGKSSSGNKSSGKKQQAASRGGGSNGGGSDGGQSDSQGSGGSGGGQSDSTGGGSGGGTAVAGGAAGTAAKAAGAPKAEEQKKEKAQPPKDPPVKTFSDPSGSFLELAPYGITMSPGSTAAVVLDAAGSMVINCSKLTASTNMTFFMGGGTQGAIPEITISAKAELKTTLNGGESSIRLEKDADIKAAFIKKDAELKKTAQPPADKVAQALMQGDAELRAGANQEAANYLTALAQKKQEGKQKVRGGIFGVLTVVGAVVLTAATGGLAAPLVAVAVVKTAKDTANIVEGAQDIYKANRGDMSRSFNFIRDTIFGGNEQAYQFASAATDITFDIVAGKALKGNIAKFGKTNKLAGLLSKAGTMCNKSKLSNFAANIGGDLLSGAINDYIQTGKINPKNLLASVATGTLKGFGMNSLQFGKGAFQSEFGRKALNTGIGTAFGMGVDKAASGMRGEEYNAGASFVQNLIQAGLGQAFGEPIDAASGSFLMTVHEFILPGVLVPIYLTRKYCSGNGKSGWLGKGWHFSYEGRLCRDEEKGILHVQLPDGYCAAYEAVEAGNGGTLYRDVVGSGRYLLSRDDMANLWNVTDTHQFTTYCYDGEGQLVSVVDKNGGSLWMEYDGGVPVRLTTPLGFAVTFTFREGRLARMEDSAGRAVEYRYEKNLLTEVVHMDGGVSRYAYTAEGYMETSTDQTGLTYLTNEYDSKGRVTKQTLADGSTYQVQYDDRKRQVTMEYSTYPGAYTYTYNEKMAVTKVAYPDGTEETFAYDACNQLVEKTDRTGAATRMEYDARGHLVRETMPEGLERTYVYDGRGDLVSVRDNGGRERIFAYDGLHNLILCREKTAEEEWREEKFTWDPMGRLTAKEDGEGHLTRYCYEETSAYPYRTIYADGTELLCGYDELGRKLWEEDGTGRTEYAYNRNGWQTMERDGEGHETHRLYDGSGRLTALYSPEQWAAGNGKRTEYRYDFLDRLTETIHSDGSHEKQFRDGEGNIVKKVHPNAYDARTGDGEGTRYDYDGENRMLRTRYPDGGVERFFYDGTGNMVKHVLPGQYDENTDDGAGRTYTYDKEGRLLSVTAPDGTVEETNAYDLWGNRVSKTDADGYSSYYTYDLAGRPVRELIPMGRDQGDLHYRMTAYDYDADGNRVRETRYGGRYTEEGTLTEAGIDLILTFTYDARNRLVRVEDGLGARVSYRYDARGNRTSEEQVVRNGESDGGRAVLKKTRYRYDKAGRLAEKREILDSGLAEADQSVMEMAVTRYTYDANGNRTGIITPEGYHITREYDCRDRLITERVEDKENGTALTTSFTYDKAGNVTSVRQQGAEGQTREITYSHDLKDRLTRVEELDGPVVMASYDQNDRMETRRTLLPAENEQYGERVFDYDIHGNLTQSHENGKITERNEYDRKNRIVGNTDADGIEIRCRYGIQDEQRQLLTAGSRKQGRAAQTLSYDARGMVTAAQDGCGNRTGYTMDGWGRVLSVETAEGGREEYAYDCAGNVIKSTDANGNNIRYAYNSMGKVCSITDQSGNTETFRYDKEGREIRHTDRNGTVTETKYNVYGKPVLQVCTDNRGNRQIMGTWEYDSFGQLKKSVSGGFCYIYEYRPDGKLLNKWNNGRKVLSCTYYRDGSLKSQTGVSGKTLYYAYDGDGRLKYLKEGNSADSIKNADDSNVITLTEYHYTDAGRIKEIITKGGIRTSYTYDEDGNISRLTIGDGTEEGLLYDAFMIYDLNGNRTGKTGSRLDVGGKQAEMAVSYRYDSMNRLTNEDRNGAGERYAYDLCGNRLLKEHYSGSCVDVTEGYRYNERNELTERVKAESLTIYRYDKNGSIISEEEEGRRSEYRYDLLNRQIYVKTLDGKEQENFYDGENLRAGVTENGKRTTFLYHNGEILTEFDGESAPVRRHIRGIGLSCVQTTQDNAYHSYHQDEQGSTAYITGRGREAENAYQYDAFGNLLEHKESLTNRILYTDQQYDQETGQYYLRARYYNPVVGRFLQEDTYRGDGLNLYAYCANNPVVYYDPSGHVKNNCPEGAGAKPKETSDREVVYPAEQTHESARNTLMKELDKSGAFANGSVPYNGRLESSYGYDRQIGRQSLDGKVRWRLDYDPDKGVHYNFEDFSGGKGDKAVKIEIPINISYEEYKSIIDWFNR